MRTLVDEHTALVRRNVTCWGSAIVARSCAPTPAALLRRIPGEFDLIFCDPPYRLADRLEGELDSLIPRRLAPGGRLIVEGAAHRPPRLSLPVVTERRYGDT
jgi:16S rRNA G966 N2-methylase RsmD